MSTMAVQVLESGGRTDRARYGSGHFHVHDLIAHPWEQMQSKSVKAAGSLSVCPGYPHPWRAGTLTDAAVIRAVLGTLHGAHSGEA